MKIKDVNKDKIPDMEIEFKKADLQLSLGIQTVSLSGITMSGASFTGNDTVTVTVASAKKKGKKAKKHQTN